MILLATDEHRWLALVTLLAGVALFAACGPKREDRIVIGSKNFTEQIVLAELLAQHIEAKTELKVERRVNLGGTLICHQALRSGEIDVYVEYTGTALTAVLSLPPASHSAEVYSRVKSEYAQRFQLEVTEPLGFNNTFAMVIRGEDARRLKLRTLSEAATHTRGWRAGFGYEFTERPDGLPGLARIYGLKFREAPRIMDMGLLYRALKENQVDVVAGNSTDGVIAALDLMVLADDRGYFPPYDAVPIARQQTLARHPAVREALRALAGRISEEEMRRLNYAVDGEHRDVKVVVREFLAAKKM